MHCLFLDLNDVTGADVDEGNSDNIMVDDHNLYMLILKERVNVQKNFHSSIVRSFRRQDVHGRGVLTYVYILCSVMASRISSNFQLTCCML